MAKSDRGYLFLRFLYSSYHARLWLLKKRGDTLLQAFGGCYQTACATGLTPSSYNRKLISIL
jgi:hypothetical protein